MSGGEIVKLEHPLQWTRGQLIDKDGHGIFYRPPVASDAVIVELDYTTGLAWTEPAGRATCRGDG